MFGCFGVGFPIRPLVCDSWKVLSGQMALFILQPVDTNKYLPSSEQNICAQRHPGYAGSCFHPCQALSDLFKLQATKNSPGNKVGFYFVFFLLIFFLEGSEVSFFTFIKSPKESWQEKLIETVEEKRYPKVCGRLTAKALMDYSDNPLIFAIKVNEVMLFFCSLHC